MLTFNIQMLQDKLKRKYFQNELNKTNFGQKNYRLKTYESKYFKKNVVFVFNNLKQFVIIF